jgi:ATP-binding cassette, subfamily B, bacterial
MSSRWQVYRRTLRYYAPHKGAIAIALFFVLITIGINLLKPWPLKYVIDTIIPATKTGALAGEGSYMPYRPLAYACAILVGLHLIAGILNLVSNQLQVKIGLQALARVRSDLFGHLQRLSLKFHDTHRSADSMYRVSYDSQAIQSIFNKGFSSVFSAIITFVGTMIVMVKMDWQLTLLALVITPLLFYAIYFFADRIRKQSTESSETESALSSRTQEGIAGIRIIHAFGQEEYELNRFEQHCVQSLNANLKLTLTHVSSALVVGTLMSIGTAAMIYLGALHVMEGTLTIGEMLVFISYLGMLYEPLQTLSYTSWALEGAAAGAQRVFEILDVPEDIRDKPDAKSVQTTKGEITFEKVSFSYDESRRVLENISIKIEKGSAVAFVGATGAGKTTLLSLIPRFYDPTSGAVKLDGLDLRDLKKKSLRSQIGIVLQDTMLLAGTIRQNIAYGRLGATSSEIEAAGRAACVHDFASQLPKGYDTDVGERGVRLSVGQRQRIGIARAFLKNAPILLLDEPTSALDPETEAGIMETLRELMKGRTTVIVTHRIATVHHSDRIFVLENGRIIEEGLGPDLLQKQSTYARLYQAQTQQKA